MTETEWRTCGDSQELMGLLYWHFKDPQTFGLHESRKFDLVACACMRRIWHLLKDPRSRRAVEQLERIADGIEFSDEEGDAVWRGAHDAWGAMADEAYEGHYATPLLCGISDAGLAAYHAIEGDVQYVGNAALAAARFASGKTDEESRDVKKALNEEMAVQLQIIRCFFGNPFRLPSVDPIVGLFEIPDRAGGSPET